MKKILFLATHPKEVASTRYRVLAYGPALEREGYQVFFHSFFPSHALDSVNREGDWAAKGAWVARGARDRLRILRSSRFDVIFVHRELFPLGLSLGMLPLLEILRHSSGRLIYDFDDAVYLPHRQNRGMIGWFENPTSVDQLIRMASVVIAGNSFLLEHARKLNNQSRCIPTPVDTHRYFPEENGGSPEVPVIGWIGSPSTAKYIRSLRSVFERLAKTHRFRLKVIGAGKPIAFQGVNLEIRPWDLRTEAEEFRNCDIGLYPLWDDQWSRGKCGYKALQFMASGVPVVASEVGMTTEIIRHRADGILARTDEDWVRYLSELLEDPGLRLRLGNTGRETIEENYSLDRLTPSFLAAVQGEQENGKANNGSPSSPQLSEAAKMASGERQDILCFSSIDWDFVWQGHQEIMTTLARQGHRVLFVENTGVRGPRLGDLSRIQRRFGKWRSSVRGFWQVEPNLYVFSPLVLPFPYAGWARPINRWLMLSALRRWMQVMDFYQPVCWTFLPTPLTLEVIRDIPSKLLIYYCIDNFAASTPAAKRIIESEKLLLQKSDVVFVTSQQLFGYASRWSKRVHLFPFGVNLEGFEQAREGAAPPPRELKDLHGTVVGYVGGIHQWVDQELLVRVARRHRDYRFVMVGPVQTRVDQIEKEPNILLIGQKPHQEIPHYIKRFDAGIIPYRIAEYTNHVYPTKMNEYLAMGKPVISTALPEVEAFNRRYGPVVEIAGTTEEFSRALERALIDADPVRRNRRIRVAGENAWGNRIRSMQRIIREGVAFKEKRRTEGWPVRFVESIRSGRWITRWAVALALCWAVLFHTPFIWWAARPLQLSARFARSDAIVVFAGGVGESGRADESYEERVKRAVDLYNEGLAPRIYFISGFTRTFQEAELMQALAKNLGVPPAALQKETRATNTYDYVLRVREVARQQGWDRILLVTSPYHTLRADLTFRRNAPRLVVLHAPVMENSYYSRDDPVSLSQIMGILREYLGLLFYRIRGWI